MIRFEQMTEQTAGHAVRARQVWQGAGQDVVHGHPCAG